MKCSICNTEVTDKNNVVKIVGGKTMHDNCLKKIESLTIKTDTKLAKVKASKDLKQYKDKTVPSNPEKTIKDNTMGELDD